MMPNAGAESRMQATLEGREWEVPWARLQRVQGRLLPLQLDTSSRGRSFKLRKNLQFVLEEFGFDETLYVDWEAVPPTEDSRVPLLAAIPLAEQERQEARLPRKLVWDPQGNVQLPIPTRLLNGEGTAEPGLGLDLDGYSNSNRFVFEPLPMEELFAVRPVGYESEVV